MSFSFKDTLVDQPYPWKSVNKGEDKNEQLVQCRLTLDQMK